MKNELLQEWNGLLNQYEDVYVYGAANTAKAIMRILNDTGQMNKFRGCLVTNKADNPQKLEGVPVTEIMEFKDKEALILVPHLGTFKIEILKLLNEMGFSNVFEVRKFLELLKNETPATIDDAYMQRAKKEISCMQKNKLPEELLKEQELLKEICQIRDAGRPDFGGVQFYQSFEYIGIAGQRPSLYRIYKYGLDKIMNIEKTVLDIGCNSGFLDMSIAPLVNQVTGIEYDKALFQIAERVKRFLNRNNCQFINMDFKEWNAGNENKYDIILSLAIHHWLGLTADEYVGVLNNLLNADGYLCLESHDLEMQDIMFEQCLALLRELGYVTVEQGYIQDDGLTKREYLLLQKKLLSV